MKIIENKKIFLTVGLSIMAASILIIGIFGLKLGIDFTGGALTEVSYYEAPEQSSLEERVNESVDDLGAFSVRVSSNDTGWSGYIIRTRDLTEPERESLHSAVVEVGEGKIDRFTSIGPVIGEELKSKAVWAIGGVALIIILYVAFAFAGVGKPVGSWVYGGITIFALIHDVLVPAALMSLLGLLFGAEVDVLFVMALLAVLGYSVNDTIVVFDRVRENLIRYRQEKKKKTKDEFGQPKEEIDYVFTKPFSEIVNESVNQTIARSINTSVTTLLALTSLYIIGGSVTQTFALILIAGVLAGTYSSIFLASPLLVYMAERSAAKEDK